VIPSELKELLDEYAGDSDTAIYIEKAEMVEEELLFTFSFSYPEIGDQEPIYQTWQSSTVRYKTSNIKFEIEDELKLYLDHPLLWDFQDYQADLYYKGEVKDLGKLFYDLYKVHTQLYEGFKEFAFPFSEESQYFTPFKYSNGLLISGAKKSLLQYGEVLSSNGLDFYLLNEKDPTFWNGSMFEPEASDLKLLQLGRSFVIAQDFSFMRL
jgi:hypothetical protein